MSHGNSDGKQIVISRRVKTMYGTGRVRVKQMEIILNQAISFTFMDEGAFSRPC